MVHKESEPLCLLLLMDWNFLIQFVLARGPSWRRFVEGRLGPRVYIGSPSKKC